ncbi:hypothetical protein [Paraburkholderia sp. SG-MS1]|uniref:hypothetical protein n=1 Tax=Paraburkholderia sp. SG-MS1 TaxID=2023741 RepID=UPI001EEBAF6F|nr:hypothetical protein [Paraburkholderia sp. SG-MS1]
MTEKLTGGATCNVDTKRRAAGVNRLVITHIPIEKPGTLEYVGYTGKATMRTGYKGNGLQNSLTQCGILMHSSLAVTTEGLPLGLSAIKFWTRSKFKGCTALKRHVNPTRVPIAEKESYRWLENMRESSALLGEPGRCIHVGDRESDIYELFCTAHDLGTHFLVRTCVDRLAGDGQHTIDGEMRNGRVKGLHRVELRDAKGARLVVDLELRYQRMTVLPPIASRIVIRRCSSQSFMLGSVTLLPNAPR